MDGDPYTRRGQQSQTKLVDRLLHTACRRFDIGICHRSLIGVLVPEVRLTTADTSTSYTDRPVDPLVITAKYVVDATGHDASVVSTLQRKAGIRLATETGCVVGEKPLWASVGEEDTVKNTREVFPGIFVSGMAANATCGSHRMGPVFGGMLLSGKKVAQEIATKLKGNREE